VCLFRKGHPLAKSGMTMKGFLEAEHVSIVAEGTGHGMVDATILRAGLSRRVSLRVPHFIALGHILQSTDMIAVVPEAYATRTLKPFDLDTAACPVKIPDITINVLWHARNHREPANQWLRQLLFEMFAI
jgi:DNA-binding transcriptional LysR family regulator